MASNVPVEQSAAVDAPAAQEQLSVFDTPQSPTPPLPPPDEPSPLIEAAPIAAAASIAPDEPDDGDQLPPLAAADVLPPLAAAPVGIPIEPESTDAIPPLPDAAPPRAPDVDEAAVPAFLAGRSSRPPRPPDAAAPVPRDDVVPSWELTDRYGAQGGGESDGNGMFGKVFTIIAVVLILALGVAAVVLIPGLLGGSPQATPRPSLLAGASRSPLITQAASGALATPTTPVTAPPSVEPTAQSTPAPTPRLYKIKPGDTLAKISRRFDVPVADILAANPQISDASHIEVGQFIIIPLGVPPTAP
jgi:LysM repeat protein